MTSEGEPATLTADSPAVMKNLEMLQSIIARMSGHSGNCKAWCVTMVSAVMALSIKDGVVMSAGPALALVPWILFYFLDAYYLSLERDFRDRFNDTVGKLREDEFTRDMLFDLSPFSPAPSGFKRISRIIGTMKSMSISSFYMPVGLLILLAGLLRS